jgi:AAA family ATP:ADP antiporter
MPSAPQPKPGLLSRLVLVEKGEGRALWFAGGYFFCLLLSFYLLRPVREAMGIARGADKLPWLMTGTLLAMFIAYPLHAAIVSRMSRRQFIPRSCHFFAVHLLIFFLLFKFLPGHGGAGLGYAFYIWLSVFNLFVVSVFWGFMADVFNEQQGKRLFGVISIGGTLGAIVGAALTDALSSGTFGIALEPPELLLISLVMLEFAVACMLQVANAFAIGSDRRSGREPGPKLAEGLRLIAASRYLQMICVYMLLFTITSTLLYLAQGQIVETVFSGAAARTAAFARIDLWTNILTLLTQALITGRLLQGLGVARVLLVLPLLTLLGFMALATWPLFAALATVMVLRRGLHYAVDRPAREILYIPLGADEKYKAKTFIDTFIYRGGDFLGVWTPTLLAMLAIPLGAVALLVSGAWIGAGLWLGAMVRKR